MKAANKMSFSGWKTLDAITTKKMEQAFAPSSQKAKTERLGTFPTNNETDATILDEMDKYAKNKLIASTYSSGNQLRVETNNSRYSISLNKDGSQALRTDDVIKPEHIKKIEKNEIKMVNTSGFEVELKENHLVNKGDLEAISEKAAETANNIREIIEARSFKA